MVQDILNFEFLEVFRPVPVPYFVHDFSRKIFLLYSKLTKCHCLTAFTS